MFLFCCDPPQESKREPLAEIDHLNPINRRINSRKTSKAQEHKSDRSQLSSNGNPLPIHHNHVSKPLSKSIFLPEGQEHKLKVTKLSEKTSHSAHKATLYSKRNLIDLENPLKNSKSRLDKSFTILQKSTRTVGADLSRNELSRHNRIKAQLLQLKERLKKVDLTKICKGLESRAIKIGDVPEPYLKVKGNRL